MGGFRESMSAVKIFVNALNVRLLLAVVIFLVSCQSIPGLPERVYYDCNFYIEHYLPDAPKREIDKLSELAVWVNMRIKGGLKSNPGAAFMANVERDRWGVKGETKSRIYRRIWLIPSELTKISNPMNVLLERRGDRYILIRISDEDRQSLRFSSIGIESVRAIKSEGIGYCDRDRFMSSATQ